MDDILKELGIEREILESPEGKNYLPGLTNNAVESSEISDEDYIKLCADNGYISDGSELAAEKRSAYLETITEDMELKVLHRDRILTIKGSDESTDRHGDIVRVDGWITDDYQKNPVFLWGHDYDKAPIGRTLKVWKRIDQEDKSKNGLMFQVFFPKKNVSEESDNVFKLYKAGILSATSVGFMPTKANQPKSDQERLEMGLGIHGVEFTEQKLWELSAVSVPSNPNALVELSAENEAICKSLGIKIERKPQEEKSTDVVELIKELSKEIISLRSEVSEMKSILKPTEDVEEVEKDVDLEPDSKGSEDINIYDAILESVDKAIDVEDISDIILNQINEGVQNG